jgi:hypothetical protein
VKMMTLGATLAVGLFIATGVSARAQMTPNHTVTWLIKIAGETVTCTSNGSRVAWEASYELNDVGDTRYGNPVVIRYNPAVLDPMPNSLKLFWLGHECGHAFLRTADESKADCWSAQTGVRQHWFGPEDADELEREMQNNPGDFSHPPGPERAAHVKQCVKQAAGVHDDKEEELSGEQAQHPSQPPLENPDYGPRPPNPTSRELNDPDGAFIKGIQQMLQFDADTKLAPAIKYGGVEWWPFPIFFGSDCSA